MHKQESRRLFCAIKIDPGEAMRQDYTLLRKELHHAVIKWVPESNMHLTLWFFGSVETNEK
jgi:2'-5' RNA ligase